MNTLHYLRRELFCLRFGKYCWIPFLRSSTTILVTVQFFIPIRWQDRSNGTVIPFKILNLCNDGWKVYKIILIVRMYEKTSQLCNGMSALVVCISLHGFLKFVTNTSVFLSWESMSHLMWTGTLFDNAQCTYHQCMLLSLTSLRGDSAVSLSLVNHDSSSWLKPRWGMKRNWS
jgi:hypothetical protein